MTRRDSPDGSTDRPTARPGDVCPNCDRRCKVLLASDGSEAVCSGCAGTAAVGGGGR